MLEHLVDLFEQAVLFYQHIPSETWVVVLGAGGVSVITQFGKRLLKLESEKVIQVLFASVAFIASGLQYLTTAHNIPPTILGIHTATLMGVATPVYFFIVRPIDRFFKDVKSFAAAKRQQVIDDKAVDDVKVPQDAAELPPFDA